MNRQETVCTYIHDNLVQFGRLRHDVISNKVQICTGVPEDFESLGRAEHPNSLIDATVVESCTRDANARWRDITTADINDIVCNCSVETGLQITSREVLAVLQSHRIPDVHPLREYVLRCRPYSCKMANSSQLNKDERLVVRGCIKHPMPLNRLGMILKKAGYPSKRVGKQGIRGWLVYEREQSEINANRRIEAETY